MVIVVVILFLTLCLHILSETVTSFTIDLSHEQDLFENIFLNRTFDLIFGSGVSDIKINVSEAQTYQKILGYGGCFSDSSAELLNGVQKNDQRSYDLYMERVFGDLGIRILRLPVASNDYISTSKYYTYQDDPSQRFSIQHDQGYYIPILRDILDRFNDTILLSSPWSAPGWMKDSGSIEGGSLSDYKDYTEYIKNYVRSYKKAGVNINFMTLQNEPYYSTADYPCMYVDQVKFVQYLLQKNEEEGVSNDLDGVKLLIHDHNWNLESDVESVIKSLMNDFPEEFPVYGIAWHAYGGERMAQKDVVEKFPSLDLHTFFTEITAWESSSDRKKNFNRDFRWSLQNIVIGSTRNLAETVLYFNLLLDENHGPTPRTDSQAYGLTTLKRKEGEEGSSPLFVIETELYAVSHISAFVNHGEDVTRIYSETFVDGVWKDIDSQTQEEKDQNPDGPLESVAFLVSRGEWNEIVVLVLNPSWTNEKIFDVVYDDNMYVTYTIPTESAVTFVRKIQH